MKSNYPHINNDFQEHTNAEAPTQIHTHRDRNTTRRVYVSTGSHGQPSAGTHTNVLIHTYS